MKITVMMKALALSTFIEDPQTFVGKLKISILLFGSRIISASIGIKYLRIKYHH